VSGSAVAAWSALAALLTITPGVDMALVARSALARGHRAALSTTGGIVSGLLVWGAASAAGVAALVAASASAYDLVRLAGAAYLVWLGVRTLLRAGTPAPAAGARRARAAYATGLLSNLTNPKIVVFYTTVLPTFIPAGADVFAWSLALAAIHAAMGLAWLSAYAWALHRARGLFERPRVRRALDSATGTVLIALGARLAAE
jgi:threonine/homoserine/homoserine lactone efflux protein